MSWARLYEAVSCDGESFALAARMLLAGSRARLLVLSAGGAPKWGFLDAARVLGSAGELAGRLAGSCGGDCAFLVEASGGGRAGRGAVVRGWLWGREARVEAGGARAAYVLGRPRGLVGYELFAASLRGPRRANEDSGLVASVCVGGEVFRLVAVADGAGGLGGGDVASSIAIAGFLASAVDLIIAGAPVGDALVEALEDAGAAVTGHVARTGKRIASTLAAAAIAPGGSVYYASVGDSPVIVVDSRGARVVSELQRIERPGGGSALTSYLGGPMEVSAGRESVEPPALVVVESDGVYEYVGPEELEALTTGHADTIASWLVGEALRRGSGDNVTAAVGVVRGLEGED